MLALVAQEGCRVSILGDFKRHLDKVLGSLLYWAQIEQGELDMMTSRVPFEPQSFCDSVKNKPSSGILVSSCIPLEIYACVHSCGFKICLP